MKTSFKFLAVASLLVSGSAFASSESFDAIFTGGNINYAFPSSVSLPSFDTNLGTLNSVTITIHADSSVFPSVYNGTGANQIGHDASASFSIVVSDPYGLAAATTLSAYAPGLFPLAPGVNDLPAVATSSTNSSSLSSGFAGFESAGPVNLTFNIAATTGIYSGSSVPGVFFGGNATASGDVQITYAYTTIVAVPEPEQYGMLLLGLPLISWVARRKQAA